MTLVRSMLSVLAAWVAWVYLLSLLVLLGLPEPPPVGKPRPNVLFVAAEMAFECPAAADRNALEGIEVEVSEPLDHDVVIPIKAIRGSARPAEHYEADSDAAAIVKAGETRGRIRLRDDLLDVTVRPTAVGAEPLRFTLELQNTLDVVAAPDPLGRREVVLLPSSAEPPPPPPGRLVATGFGEPIVTVPERDFAGHRFVVRSDRPADVDADMLFELRRGIGDTATVVRSFRRVMPQGAAEVSFSLTDVFTAAELRDSGLADDDVPGPDEYYELHVDPRPPLIGAGDPCFQAVVVADDDAAADLGWALEDERGSPMRRITPNVPYWVRPTLSRPLERDCNVVPIIGGEAQPGGVIPAGEMRGPRFGPFTEDGARETLPVSIEGEVPTNGLPRCPSCEGHGHDCPDCRADRACKRCQGRAGGCESCRNGRGPCPGCGGRQGGCLACGFGKGSCSRCGGQGGDCSICGGKGPCDACNGKPGTCPGCDGEGKCGACQGKGGDCTACRGSGKCGDCKGDGGACPKCRGGGGPVKPGKPRNVPAGPPVKGDFLLLLVNNERLHEPGDSIASKVVEAIKDEKPYRDAAFVVNEKDETELKVGSPLPSPSATFRPFSREGEDLSGQVRRLVETIREKRDSAATDNLPTVVIWPEREISSAADLAPLAALAAQGGGPISVLCPDADPEKSRLLAAALQPPEGAKDRVTVRSPKTPELVEHVRDVIHAGRRQSTPATNPGSPKR